MLLHSLLAKTPHHCICIVVHVGRLVPPRISKGNLDRFYQRENLDQSYSLQVYKCKHHLYILWNSSWSPTSFSVRLRKAFCNVFCEKNTIRDGGSTTLYTAYNVCTVYTVCTVQTTLHCLNVSMYACIYCWGRLERYWNGLTGFCARCWVGDTTRVTAVLRN